MGLTRRIGLLLISGVALGAAEPTAIPPSPLPTEAESFQRAGIVRTMIPPKTTLRGRIITAPQVFDEPWSGLRPGVVMLDDTKLIMVVITKADTRVPRATLAMPDLAGGVSGMVVQADGTVDFAGTRITVPMTVGTDHGNEETVRPGMAFGAGTAVVITVGASPIVSFENRVKPFDVGALMETTQPKR